MKSRFIIIFLAMLVLSAISISGSEDWREWNNDLLRNAIETDIVGKFEQGVQTLSTTVQGFDTQPMATDIDSDGVLEMIILDDSSSSLIDYGYENDSLFIKNQAAFTGNHDDLKMTSVNLGTSILVLQERTNNKLFLWEYQVSGGVLTLINENVVSNDADIQSGIACDTFTTVPTGDYCYFFTDKSSGTGDWTLRRLNLSNFVVSNLSLSNLDTSAYMWEYAPAITNLDGASDPDKEIIFILNVTVGTRKEGPIVFGHTSFTEEDRAHVPGYIFTSAGTPTITGFSIENPDGGNREVVMSWFEAGYNGVHDEGTFLSVSNSALDKIMTAKMIGVPDEAQYSVSSSNHLFTEFTDTHSGNEFCMLSQLTGPSSPSSFAAIHCVGFTSGDASGVLEDSEIGQDKWFVPGIPIVSARMGIDTDQKYSIVTGSNVFMSIGTTSSVTVPIDVADNDGSGGQREYFPIITDINGDSIADVCGTKEDSSFCALSVAGNGLPTYLGPFGSTVKRCSDTVANLHTTCSGVTTTLDHYYTPVCLNSSVTFFAQECITDGCIFRNYINDVQTDLEKMIFTCPGGTEENTSFFSETGNFTCTFNQIGDFDIQVIMVDNFNDDDEDRTTSATIHISVVNGTQFSDCDIAASPSDLLPLNVTEIVDDSQFFNETQVGLGSKCFSNAECQSGNCFVGFCHLAFTNMECTLNSQCLSGTCSRGFCTKAPSFGVMQEIKNRLFGDDETTNYLISMFIVIWATAAVALLMKQNGMDSKNVGLIGIATFVITMVFVILLGWLDPFLLVLVGIIIGIITIIFFMSRITLGGGN